MGEHYVAIAFGVLKPPAAPGDGYYSWVDLAEQWAKTGKHPNLKKTAHDTSVLVESGSKKVLFAIESSYEARPGWLGVEVWHSPESYKTTRFDEIIADVELARAAWLVFRDIVKAETGIVLGEGHALIATDHT